MDSSDHPLYVALFWHLHQPFYKDLLTGDHWMPWVRLHAIKDYYAMAQIAKEFPHLRLNFNLVPSLLEQLEDYANHDGTDTALQLSLKPPRDLDPEEKVDILAHFFSANWETMIAPFPRYRELLEKRGRIEDRGRWSEIQRYFSNQDLQDIQVWFNLAWFNFVLRETDPFLKGLVQKGRNYSEGEKIQLLAKQREVIQQVIPLYRELFLNGQIELTTSPYFHPILPLLCDTDVSKESSPDMILPRSRFRHPEDALLQMKRGLDAHFRHFKRPAQGMWPPEGAVSQEMAQLAASVGFRWMATDEKILFRSLELPLREEAQTGMGHFKLLYQPVSLRGSNFKLDLVFRDHVLSDLIGFTYARWDPKVAAKDFLGRLHQIQSRLKSSRHDGPFLVTIILDGENAWEYYRNDGRDFLSFLYEGLRWENGLQSIQISEFLERFPPRHEIGRIASGSWINHNFRVWIGHPEDNAAWDLLGRTRDDLVSLEKTSGQRKMQGGGDAGSESLQKAWEEVYIAEGSDWCWWYGDDHSSGMDEEFDGLFRKHLMNVYSFMGAPVPDRLHIPLTQKREKVDLTLEPAGFIHPLIDGRITNYFEWILADSYHTSRAGDAMHRSRALIEGIYVGFDPDKIFLRIDMEEGSLKGEEALGLSLQVSFLAPIPVRLKVGLEAKGDTVPVRLDELDPSVRADPSGGMTPVGLKVAVGRIIELEIPLAALKVESGQEIQFAVGLQQNGTEWERWPRSNCFRVRVPSKESMADLWQA
jgi:alpha-amylase/alpha-mannosidase (GH57 family)